MSHVPSFSHDVFLSYAHLEDPTWIEGFEAALRQSLRDRLGHEISGLAGRGAAAAGQ